jgi:hypothetical protein
VAGRLTATAAATVLPIAGLLVPAGAPGGLMTPSGPGGLMTASGPGGLMTAGGPAGLVTAGDVVFGRAVAARDPLLALSRVDGVGTSQTGVGGAALGKPGQRGGRLHRSRLSGA